MENLIECVIKERTSVYGDFNDISRIQIEFLNVLFSSPNYSDLSAIHKSALDMIFHKIARMLCGDPYHLDNVVDIEGYARLIRDHIEKHNNG